MKQLRRALCCVGMLLPACRVYGVSKYAGAAIFAGSAVAATAVNRKLTHDCWAVCSPGWHCNHDSGLCESDEEEPPRHPHEWPSARRRAHAPLDASRRVELDASRDAGLDAATDGDALPSGSEPEAGHADAADAGLDSR